MQQFHLLWYEQLPVLWCDLFQNLLNGCCLEQIFPHWLIRIVLPWWKKSGRNCVSFYRSGLISIWSRTYRLKKKLDGNYTRMLRAILNKSWRQHPTRHQLYGNLSPITKNMQVRRTRHAGQCWRSKDELTSDVLLWTPAYGQAKAGRPARTYIQQLYEDTGCSPEDLPKAMNDRGSGERGSGISVLAARLDDDSRDEWKKP